MQHDLPDVTDLLARRAEIPRGRWTTDRWGRLVAGAFVMAFLLPVCLQEGGYGQAFVLLAAGTGAVLVLTALAGWCPFHELFKRLGIKDREEVFAEGLRAHTRLEPRPEAFPPLAPGARALESSPIHEAEEAHEYNRMVRRHGWLLNKPFVDMLSAEHGDLKQARVLDLGTGPGWIPIQLALRHPGWECWAVDVSEDMLALGREHARACGVADRVHFVKAGADSLPFEAGSFDLVVSHFVLHHLPRPETLFDEAARVAGNRGRVVIKDLRRVARLKAAVLLAFSKLVLRYSAAQMKMYRESIAAALTMAEVRASLQRSRLAGADVRGFRGLDFVITSLPARRAPQPERPAAARASRRELARVS